MTVPALLPRDPDIFQDSEPLEMDNDFTQAVMDVAHEMNARQSRRDRWWDAARSVFLLLAVIRYSPRQRR